MASSGTVVISNYQILTTYYRYIKVIFNIYIILFFTSRVNRLSALPRGMGTAKIEILDLTYNNLNEKSLPGNFFLMCMFFVLVFDVYFINKELIAIKSIES